MVSSLIFLLLCGNIALNLGNAQKLPKGKRPNLKVYINTTGDSILMKFLRPDPNIKLEGFLLGYGSNSHSNQYFPLPAEGKSSQAEVDAEPKYLIVVRPVPPPSQKKKCSGKSRTRQPLQMVVGTLSPSSVFLSWGFLINPQYDWTLPSQCPNDRLYTVRYREKDKEKKWIFQLCPATETVVENLKPNTIYEFGVKDNLEGGLWSRIFNHKTVVGTKNKGNGKIQSTYDQTHIVPAYIPKKIIPITVIKQVIQNVTHRAASKSPDRPSVGGTILVHLIIPGLNETTPKGSPPIMLDISESVKTLLAKNDTLALPVESKTPEEEKIPAQPVPVTMETVQRTTSPTMTSIIEISETTLAPNKLPEFPQAKTPFSLAKPKATLASDQIQWIVPTAKTSDGLKVLQPHPATHDMQPVFSSTPATDEPEISITPKAPAGTHYVHHIPKTSQSPDEQQTKAVFESITYVSEPPMETIASIETTPVPSKTLALPKPDAPQTKPAPKQTTHAPPKMKTTPTSVKPATKVSRPVTSKPKISPRPHASPTLPAPTERHISSSPQPSLSPVISPTTYVPEENTIRIKQPKTTLAPRDVHKPDPDVSQTKPVLEPVTFRIEPSKPTMAPIGTKSIPVKPKISPSPSQDVLQTTLAKAVHSTQEPATTKTPRKPKRTKTTQAPNKVYTTTIRKKPVRLDKNRTITGADRFKPNGISQDTDYIKPSSGDINKHISAPKNVSLDATKKPGTVAKTHHPILPPAKPTRRKLQPPINVTSKPGSTGTILLPRVTSPPPKVTVKPTGPTVPKKIETEKKQPTASVSGEYGNLTDFSSSPTRETDSLGNQRFVAPHVRYIPKPENEPCSITDSMKRFPTEEVSEESPTSPPQNPPTNLTVVTVEGCSSFVILDWEKPQNDTVTEYEIRSKENGAPTGKKESIQTTNQTFSTIENLKPNTSYEFQVTPRNPLGEGPSSKTVSFNTESADPRVSEPISAGRDAIWTEIPFNSDSYSECKGKQYVKRTWYKKFVGVQLCNSLRYKIYLSDSLTGKFYNIGDQRGHGEDHCQFVDSFLDGRTGQQLNSDQLPIKEGYFRAVRQEPVQFGEIGGHTQINYVQWYECGTTIPGKW
ncbi:target of Nesh-SH3 isoform X2 [Sminthopsis crassicaudata]|uniref:target of Nesh-SH3 isoform X2 n=1 Tax=Sminthopsis crassicaudata TaxID=9301 RepID=UPI003D69C0B4